MEIKTENQILDQYETWGLNHNTNTRRCDYCGAEEEKENLTYWDRTKKYSCGKEHKIGTINGTISCKDLAKSEEVKLLLKQFINNEE